MANGQTSPVGGVAPPDDSDGSGSNETDTDTPDTGDQTSPVGGVAPPDDADTGGGSDGDTTTDPGSSPAPPGGVAPPDDGTDGTDQSTGGDTSTDPGSSPAPPGGVAPPDDADTDGESSGDTTTDPGASPAPPGGVAPPDDTDTTTDPGSSPAPPGGQTDPTQGGTTDTGTTRPDNGLVDRVEPNPGDQQIQEQYPEQSQELREEVASQSEYIEPDQVGIREADDGGIQTFLPDTVQERIDYRQRQDLREDVAGESDQFTQQDVQITETEDGLQAVIPDETVQETLREDVASQSEFVDPEDVQISETDDGAFEASVPNQEALYQEYLAEQAAEEYGVGVEDVDVSEPTFDSAPPAGETAPEGTYEVDLTDEAAREQAREQLASQIEGADASEVTVEETGSGGYQVDTVFGEEPIGETNEQLQETLSEENVTQYDTGSDSIGQTTDPTYDPDAEQPAGIGEAVGNVAQQTIDDPAGYVGGGTAEFLTERGEGFARRSREAIDEGTAERVAGTRTVWSGSAITRLQDAGEFVGDEIREGAATGADIATGDFVTGGGGETEGAVEQALVGAFGEAPAAVAEAPGEAAKLGQRATQATTVAIDDPSTVGSIYSTTVGYGGVTAEQTAEQFERQPVRTTATFGALAGGGITATRGTRAAAAQRFDVSAPPSRQPPDVSGQVGTRAREAGRSVAQRTPDVEVRRDPDAPTLEVTPETRQAIRDAATAPARGARRAGQRVREVPSRAAEAIGQRAAQTRVTQQRARSERLEGVESNEALFDPSIDVTAPYSRAVEAGRDVAGSASASAARARGAAATRVSDAATSARLQAEVSRADVGERVGGALESAQAVPGRVTDRAALTRARAGQRVDDATTDVRFGTARARGEVAERASSAVESAQAVPGRIREATPRPDLELANRIGQTRERAQSAFASATDLPTDSPLQGEIRPQTVNTRYFESDRPRFDPDSVLGDERGGAFDPASAASTAGEAVSGAAGRARSAVPSLGDVPSPRAYASAASELSVRIGSRPERIPGTLDAPDQGRIIEIATDGGDDVVSVTPRDRPARRFRDVESPSDDARQVALQRAETQQRSGVGTDAVDTNRFGAMLDDAVPPAAVAAAGPTLDAGGSLDEETDPTALDDVGAGQVDAIDQAPASIESELPDVLGDTDVATPADTLGESEAAATATRVEEANTPMLRTETTTRTTRPGRPPLLPPPQFPGASDDEPEGDGGVESAEELSGFYSPLSGELLEPEARSSGPMV